MLEKVCEYFYYNEKYKNAKDVPDMDIPPELCLELLMAADYLNSRFLSFWTVVCLEWLLNKRLQREVVLRQPRTGGGGVLRYDVMMYDSVL